MGWGGGKARQVPAIPVLPLCNAVVPFLAPGATGHGNGESDLLGDPGLWQRGWQAARGRGPGRGAAICGPGWVDTGEAAVDLGEG